MLGLLRIQLGFVNRLYRLARFFVTFLAAFRTVFFAAFLALPAALPLAAAAAFREERPVASGHDAESHAKNPRDDAELLSTR